MIAEVLGKFFFMAIRSRNARVDRYLRNGKPPSEAAKDAAEGENTSKIRSLKRQMQTWHALFCRSRIGRIPVCRHRTTAPAERRAPNILVMLLDDAGFAATSTFGGPCQTPNSEKLASSGLKYNRFHATALCSPTRQALLTGRNHHSVGMGGITEIATSAPGYCSILPTNKAPLPMTLKLNATRRPVRKVPTAMLGSAPATAPANSAGI
jgi:hypothetical protein